MNLTPIEIDRLSSLTRLAPSDEEKTRLSKELGAILGYVDRLAKVDTQNVPEAETGQEAFTGRLDEPMVQDPSVREQIIQNFPDSLAQALRVPAVFEHPKK